MLLCAGGPVVCDDPRRSREVKGGEEFLGGKKELSLLDVEKNQQRPAKTT